MTVRNRTQLDGLIDSLFPSAGSPRITAEELREWLQDMLDSITLTSELTDETAAEILTKILTVDGSGSGLDADLLDGMTPAQVAALGTDTAAEILTKLLTVDGAGSGLDADLLDGMTPAQLIAGLASLASPSLTGTPTAPTPPASDSSTRIATTAQVTAAIAAAMLAGGGDGVLASAAYNDTTETLTLTLSNGTILNVPLAALVAGFITQSAIANLVRAPTLSGRTLTFTDAEGNTTQRTIPTETAAQILTKLLTVDGSGSGLDADLLDGMTPAQVGALGTESAADILAKILTVDGTGSGLDADLLDGMTPAEVAALGGGSGGFTFRFGAGAPANSLGDDGDRYLDTTAGGFYSKAGGAWTLRYTDMTGAGGGLNQAQVDARITALAALLSGADFTGAVSVTSPSGGPLTVQGENAGNSTIMKIFTPDSGTQKAFGAGREGEFDWVQFAGEIVTGKPGFALGPGTARDTNIYREEANHMKTDDAFTAAGDLTTEGDLSAVGGEFTAVVTGVTPTADLHLATKAYVDTVAAGGSGQMHDLIAGWSADTTITDAELNAGAMSMTDTVTLPGGSGNQYLFIWRADVDGGDPTEVHIAGSGNQRNSFGAAVARTLDGTAGQLIVSVTTQNVGLLSAEDVRVV